MNPHAVKSVSPVRLVQSLLDNHRLIFDLSKREVVGRYRGSAMGLLWSFFNPALMLVVYTFVFSVVFKARWAGGSGSKMEFALVLFAGLMLFNLFAECVNRAPHLILGNVSYVKKVIFPLEILAFVNLGSALFHFFISLVVWLIFYAAFFGTPPLSLIQLPLIVLPVMLLTLGCTWLFASLGVYLRDVSQVIVVLTTILLFMSPVFYPLSALSAKFRLLMRLNPLTFPVEQARATMIWGTGLDWTGWFFYIAFASFVAWLGFAWFQKTRKGFADVI